MLDYPIGARRRALQVVFALSYLIIIVIPCSLCFLSRAGEFGKNFLPRIGELLILAAFPMLSLQPVLAARLVILDQSFGLDTVYIVHKSIGMTAATILLCAVVFLVGGGGISQNLPGIVSAAVLVVLVLSAFLYREFRMSYEAWRRLHNGLALTALAALFLQALLITPINGKGPMPKVLALYFAAGVIAYIQHRIVGPMRRGKKLYRIDHVVREAPNVWSLALKPPEGVRRFDFLPGQFQFLTFNRGRGEEHPFTISSSPTLSSVHTATIKESGDFTRGIGMVRPGDLLAVQAPFGRFSYLLYPAEQDIVFIAGGIGITPIMSMLRHMHDSAADKNVQLFYANRSEEDIVFKRELAELAATEPPRLRVTHVLSRPKVDWIGERGHIDWPVIEKNVNGDLRAKAYYVCGPASMMSTLITVLIDKGIPSSQVRSERFSL